MKNFRKVLALILVVATLFSLTAMISAKTTEDYEDGDDVNYVDAVDVLSAIGILEGYTDNSFQPTKNIQREEMAKMVAVLSNAGDDVEDLYASACSFADSKNSWAASYIAYCTQTGIVAGRSASIFDPNANVTGLETAKMLLVVLGFDATEQGYVGTNWKTNVLRDAKNVGLLSDFAAGYDISKAITREEAAQMFLNALKAHLVVGTLSNNVVTISNASRVNFNSNTENGTVLLDGNKFGFYNLYGNVVVSRSILASTYRGLEVSESRRDCLGRPGSTWTYTDARGKVILDKFYPNATDKVYTTVGYPSTDYKTIGEYVTATGDVYNFNIYVDGTRITRDAKGNTISTVADALDYVGSLTGNGVRVEVYVDADAVNRSIDLIVINPYWGRVTAVSELFDTFTVYCENLNVSLTFGRDGQEIKKNDVVLFHLCSGTLNHSYDNYFDAADGNRYHLHDVAVVKPVRVEEVEYTRAYTYYDSDNYFTGDGTEYYYTKGAVEFGKDDIGSSQNIYLDEYGYVFFTREISETYSYGYVVEGSVKREATNYLDQNGKWVYDYVYTGTVVTFADEAGTLELTKGVVLSTDNGNTDKGGDWDVVDLMVARGLYLDPGCGSLIKYHIVDDKLVLVGDDGTKTPARSEFAPQGTQVSKSENELYAGQVYANRDTEFMIRTTNQATGAQTYTEVIGYQNLPQTYVSQTVNKGTKELTTIQYIDENKDGIAEYVFIDASVAKVSTTFIILDTSYSANSITLPGYENYESWTALVNGEDAWILFPKGTVGKDINTGVLYKNAYMILEADTRYDYDEPIYVYAESYDLVEMDAVTFNLNKSGDEYQVNLGTVGNPRWVICAENFNIFYIDDYWTNNYNPDLWDAYYWGYVDTWGYVKISNNRYPELTEGYDSLKGYVLTDANGHVTDIYITEFIIN